MAIGLKECMAKVCLDYGIKPGCTPQEYSYLAHTCVDKYYAGIVCGSFGCQPYFINPKSEKHT